MYHNHYSLIANIPKPDFVHIEDFSPFHDNVVVVVQKRGNLFQFFLLILQKISVLEKKILFLKTSKITLRIKKNKCKNYN